METITEGKKKKLKKELKSAFNQGLQAGRADIVTKTAPSPEIAPPGSPERDEQIKRIILGQSGGKAVLKAKKEREEQFKKRRREAVKSIAKKTFREFIEESQEVLDKISSAYQRKYPGMKLHAYMSKHPESIRVHSIEVPEKQRNQGIGSRAMKGLGKYADKNQLPISLTPGPNKGKKQALERFYKKQGFKRNKGKEKDFRFSDAMIRNPKNTK